MSNLSTIPDAPNRYPLPGWAKVGFNEDSSTASVYNSKYGEMSTVAKDKKVVLPHPPPVINYSAGIDATVIQLWEGRVLEVDLQNGVMQVLLTAKLIRIAEHTAEIELQWVSEQDRDLVVAGAVFYLTLYKQTRHGSVKNSQELRFRRRPVWTKRQVQKIYEDADLILAKMQPRPAAA